jgi:hypothetical protein
MHANNFDEVIDDLSFDDNWITKEENYGSSLNFALISVLDSTPRRKNSKNDKKIMKKNFLMMLKYRVMEMEMI